MLGALRTRRLVLRPWQDSDREPFAAMNADAEVMRHFPGRLTRVESDALIDRLCEKAASDGYAFHAVALHDGTFIGLAGLAKPGFKAPFTPCTEVGWRLARAHWGKGYATEAASAAIDWGFGELGLGEIVSFTALANDRSERVMQRLGMVRDPGEDFDHPSLPGGHPLQRHMLYRLTRAAWKVPQ